jgi:hypothetical protein
MRRGALVVVGSAALLATLSACDLPFGLGQPTTRALENGAVANLDAAKSFRLSGSYNDQLLDQRVTVDLQFVRPGTEHVVVTSPVAKVEAIILGADAYFRGNEFLSAHMGSDPLSRNLVKVAGNSWWRGTARPPTPLSCPT